MVTDDQARTAWSVLNEKAAIERRKTGTIVGVSGRRVSVLLDGEGTSVLTAYRGAFEPAEGAGVTIERVVGTNHWRVVGIRDSALGTVNSLPYDFEVRGDVLYYPLALEAVNDSSYNLGSNLEITVYNIQYLDADSIWQYIDAETVDMVSYLPASDSLWAVIYADRVTNAISVYAHIETTTPDGEWVAAVNGLLSSVATSVPLIAIRLDAGITEWGAAWKVIKRGYSFDGKYIVRVPYTAQTELGGIGWNVTPPTSADLDAEFGTAATVGAGFTGIIDDAVSNPDTMFLAVSDGTNWWYTPLRPAT